MARGANPFYYQADSQLGAGLGATLGRALFGDPEAAAQLALRKAQMENYSAQADEATSHAGLYHAQTDDQQVRTGYRKQFGPLGQTFQQIASGGPAPAPAAGPPAPLVPLPAAAEAAPAAAPADTKTALARALIPMIMAAGGAQENPNIGDMVGGVTALLGNDELARRGMVAGGKTPGKEFALTPQRADDIAQQGYTADFNKDTTVAKINHYNDIPVAQANHASDVAVARANHASDIPVANVQADARRDVAQRRGSGSVPAAKAAKLLSPASYKMLFGDKTLAESAPGYLGELDRQVAGRAWPEAPDDGTLSHIRAAVVANYQRTGNPVGSVSSVLDEVKRRWDAKQADAPPVGGARKAPDGHWYVKQGSGYARVDVVDERARAAAAIKSGAPRAAVSQLFKQRTGQDL